MPRPPTSALFGFAAVAASAVGGLLIYRQYVIRTLGTPEAIAQWRLWHEETVIQSRGSGPFQRRETQAMEPPMLILMRDHFVAATVSMLLALTVLYWFLYVIVRGSIRTKPVRGELAELKQP